MNMQSALKPVDGKLLEIRTRFGERPTWQRTALIGTPILALAAGFALLGGEPSTAAAPPPPMVTIAAPIERQINQWDDFVGRFEASRSVEIRPRVSGAITGIHFTDGSLVRQGQLLFTIDPRPYTAALAEARAGVATAS